MTIYVKFFSLIIRLFVEKEEEHIYMSKIIYKQRRENLSTIIPNNSAIIISGADNCYRNADSAYAFRQESSFYYLSGFCEASSVMLLINENNKIKSIIFVPLFLFLQTSIKSECQTVLEPYVMIKF